MTSRHFQVKMNKKKLFEYKYTKNKYLENKIFKSTIKCEKEFARSVT